MKKKNIWNRLGKLIALAVAICLAMTAIVPLAAQAADTESTDDLVLLEVESVYEWNEGYQDPCPLTVKTEGAPDGSKYISMTATGVAMLSRAFDAVDISAYANGYFHLYLYVEDASKLTGGQIELTSSGNADNCEMNWEVTSLGLVNGWNELYLPVANAGSQGGTADLSAINYFRVYFLFNDSMEVGIDHMSMTKVLNVKDTVILEVNHADEFRGSGLATETADAPDGNTYVSCTAESVAVFATPIDALNLSLYADGYLHLYLYVEDASRVTGGQIELSSSEQSDVNEMNWEIADLKLVNGWNELYLPVAKAGSQGGEADLHSINYIRVFCLYNGTMKTGIDHVSMTRVPNVEDTMLLEVSAADELRGSGLVTETVDAPDGNAYVSCTAESVAVFATPIGAVDLSLYANGYLHFYLYVEDASRVTGGQIELSSSEQSDVNEMNWEVANLKLVNGWNELYLPVAEAGSQGGDADLSAINYIRVFCLYSGTMKTGVDCISMTNGITEETPEPETPPTEPETPSTEPDVPAVADKLLLAVGDIYEWNEGFIEPTPLTVKTEGAPDGNAYVACTGTDVAMLSRAFDAVDLTPYKNGYLHLYLYVEDASKLTGGQIELTSSRNADNCEMNWEITSLGLVDGWNELLLPMSEAGSQGGTADLSAINYFRVYFLYSGTMEVGIDHISVSQDDNPETGDPIMLCVAILAASGIGVAAVARKKETYCK